MSSNADVRTTLVEAAAPVRNRSGLMKRLLDNLTESRMRQVEREVARLRKNGLLRAD